MLNELFNYEKVLLLLGIALFLVLLIGLLIFIIRKEPIHKFYLAGFFIPIVMIAYPSIQKVSFLNDFFILEKNVKELEENPNSEQVRADLKKAVEELEQRPIQTPERMVELSKAHLLLENVEKAEEYVNHALEQQPENQEAVRIKGFVELEKTALEYKKEPSDSLSRKNLMEKLRTLEAQPQEASKAEKQIISRTKQVLDARKAPAEAQ